MGETSRVADGNSRNTAPELPGFYFDAERNRYFRLLPGMNNHNPLTMSDIAKRKSNEELEMEEAVKKRKMKEKGLKNIAISLNERCLGINSACFKRNLLHAKLRFGEKIIQKNDIFIYPTGISPSKDYKRYFVYSVNRVSQPECSQPNPGYVYINALAGSCCHIETDPDKGLYTYWNSKLILFSPNKLVHFLCRSLFCCASTLSKHCKYAASFGDGKSAVLITNLETLFSYRNRSGSQTVQRNDHQQPIRSFHRRGGPGFTTVHLDQDILAQAFSYDPNLHYNGLRSGDIVGLDIRKDRRNSKAFRISHTTRGNVKQIQPLKDGVSLIVGYKTPSIEPSIYLWDIRFTRKPVLQYDTHFVRCRLGVDTTAKPRFLINIDTQEQIMTSVLSDYRARFWHIPTGEIIKVYPDFGESTEKAATLSMCNPHLGSSPKGSFAMVGYYDGSVDYFTS